MLKNDRKIMQYRMDGMVYAVRVIEAEGMEAFKKELRGRKATMIPIEAEWKRAKEMFDQIVTRVFNSFSVASYKALNDAFSFGKIRLNKFKDAFNEITKDIRTFDRYGDVYYTFSDYAKEFNEKYDLGIDMDSVEEVDRINGANGEKMVSFEAVKDLLIREGHTEAAEYIQRCIGEKE